MVTVRLSEPVQLIGRGIRVLGPSGSFVASPPATVDGTEARLEIGQLDPGTYVVEWQVLSADTHPTRGRFAFSVGQTSRPAVDPMTGDVGQVTLLGLVLQTAGRWLHFGGVALGFGGLAFALLTARRRREAWWPLLLERSWSEAGWGASLLILAEPVALLAQSASLGVDTTFDPDTLVGVLGSSFGLLLGFRAGAALLLWMLAGAAQLVENEPSEPKPLLLAAACLGLALSAVDAFSSHAGSFRPAALGLAVQSLHSTGMALWLGAAMSIAIARRKLSGERLEALRSSARWPVLLGLLLVGATGVAMAAVHIPSLGALVESGYGKTLLAKQVLLGLTLSAAALARVGRSRLPREWWSACDLAALVAVVGSASLLVSLPPPR